jgi:hypothetical protein
MSRERWGTFSVMDHQLPNAFVAEVLLYDRLVIPVPPNEDERKRWRETKRDPDKLDADLQILGDKAILVPWGEEQHQAFKTIYETAKTIASDAKYIEEGKKKNIDPLYVTRMLLTKDFLPQVPKGVIAWAMAAYPSFYNYEQDMDKKSEDVSDAGARKENLAIILSHKFLVPDDPGRSPEQLLKQAVELSMRDDFIEHRIRLHSWEEGIIQGGITDKKAVEELEQYVNKYNEVVAKAVDKVGWKFGFLVINLALDFIGAAVINPLLISKAAVDVWQFMKLEKHPDIDAGECNAAAMIYDVQKEFNWKVKE